MESSSEGNLCAALCSTTKRTGNITQTTDDDRGGKEDKVISKKGNLFRVNSVSDLAYSSGACVEQLHLFLFTNLNPCHNKLYAYNSLYSV